MAEVVTGEAVVLDLAVARFPNRILAEMIDIAVQWVAILFIEGAVFDSAAGHLNPASETALWVVGFVLVTVAYPTTFETLSRGKTLGKLALGIRVVSDDGGPERFRQALIRALAATFIEIWPPVALIGMPIGLTTSMVSAKGKRLGDLFAGTFVIQERTARRPDLPALYTYIPPPLLEWAHHVELSRLPEHTAAAAGSYLRRFPQLRQEARISIGMAITSEVFAYVSPPPPAGTPADIYLGAVLTIRRTRDRARLARAAETDQPAPQPAPPPGPQPAAQPAWPAQPAGPAGPASGDQGPGFTEYAETIDAPGFRDQVSADGAERQVAENPPEDYGFAKPF
jgi:uncharacterized RDD family membrane protein YckC